MVAPLADGSHFRLGVAVYSRFESGRITRIEENSGEPIITVV
ncbi:hypothetical protein [Pseudonocardia sp. ICBG1293]|nr:hypothetical protein [Pseudonocardia sp. ICBG1293]